MTAEAHNHVMRIAAALVISAVFWVGLELLASEHFIVRHVVGGTILTTLFLYAITTKAEAERQARSGDGRGDDENVSA